MLQAMNTGHDGSLTTIHANNPRETLSRLETLVLMAGMDLPLKAIRQQIASAIDLVIQLSRLKDGSRKVTAITEVIGMEGDTITMQEIFKFESKGADPSTGQIVGEFNPTGIRPEDHRPAVRHGCAAAAAPGAAVPRSSATAPAAGDAPAATARRVGLGPFNRGPAVLTGVPGPDGLRPCPGSTVWGDGAVAAEEHTPTLRCRRSRRPRRSAGPTTGRERAPQTERKRVSRRRVPRSARRSPPAGLRPPRRGARGSAGWSRWR